ncbi:hypothetical protein ACJ41O_006955 [Fusarium nematophilum]
MKAASTDGDAVLQRAQDAFDEAAGIVNGGYLETTWEGFFKDRFFEPLVRSVSVSKDDSRRVSRCNYYHDAVKLESNRRWNLFEKHSVPEPEPFESVKAPQPDYVFYLPIYHLETQPGIPTIIDAKTRRWNRAASHGLMEPFSWSTLKELSSAGLRPSPIKIFDQPPMEARLKCYPWLVIEHKKEGERPEIVCCQAANAGACAVRLNQLSTRYAVELPNEAHIPPIPTVTTIGSRVTVWIVYFAKDFEAPCRSEGARDVTIETHKQGYVMRAIWEGDVTKLPDIFKFQIILENTHTWAMRHFKPMMSTYIEQWRNIDCQPDIDAETALSATAVAEAQRQETADRCEAVLPIVQTLLANHHKLELDDRENQKVTPLFLGLLMQQICAAERQFLSSEVDRVVTERLRALEMSPETPVAESGAEHAGRPVRLLEHYLSDNEDSCDGDYGPSEDASGFEASDYEASAASSSASDASVAEHLADEASAHLSSSVPFLRQYLSDNDDPCDSDYRTAEDASISETSDSEASAPLSSGSEALVADYLAILASGSEALVAEYLATLASDSDTEASAPSSSGSEASVAEHLATLASGRESPGRLIRLSQHTIQSRTGFLGSATVCITIAGRQGSEHARHGAPPVKGASTGKLDW